jgi:hypothetical protein
MWAVGLAASGNAWRCRLRPGMFTAKMRERRKQVPSDGSESRPYRRNSAPSFSSLSSVYPPGNANGGVASPRSPMGAARLRPYRSNPSRFEFPCAPCVPWAHHKPGRLGEPSLPRKFDRFEPQLAQQDCAPTFEPSVL